MENENPNYYAVIPANVRYCKGLSSTAKLLYGEIAALANAEGYCWASNAYFARIFDLSESAISRAIQTIADSGFVHMNFIYSESGKAIIQRRIYIAKTPNGYAKTPNGYAKTPNGYAKTPNGLGENAQGGYAKTPRIIKQDNNINNIYKGTDVPAVNKSCGKTVHNFQKPTVEDVKAYCTERKNGIDAEQFYDYYESKGWTVGKTKMKDWQAAVRTWERNSFQNGKQPPKEEPHHWYEICPACKKKTLEWSTPRQKYLCPCGASYDWEVINR